MSTSGDMNAGRSATGPRGRVGSGAGRLFRAWRAMPRERRLAAGAALGLFVTMFLPWYQRQFFVVVDGKLAPGADTQTAWAQFSFVEAAVLLVAIGVLTLLFQRAEGKAFHLPGGDGWVIMAAGCWTCVLIVWRIFDKQGANAHGQHATSYGIEWGIFIALAVAGSLAYAGSRIRRAHRPEPALPGERPPPPDATATTPRKRAAPPDSAATVPRSPAPPPPHSGRRQVGWLTAPPRGRAPGPAPEWSGSPPEWAAAPRPGRRAAESAPQADEAPTIRRSQPADAPAVKPATPAARNRLEPDSELTIPLERDE